MSEVAPLAGYTVGVTAARRADELSALLERRGATVLHGPAIRIVPLADDADLVAATRTLLRRPADVVVATTGIGFRGWLEAADGWALGDDLRRTLAASTLLTRGPKAKGAVRAAGLVETWAPESESNAEVLDHLLKSGVDGTRIAVQLHGEPLRDFVDTLRAAGAEVLEVPVYRWTAPSDTAPLHRLLDAVLAGQLDALTFTSAPAAASVLRTAEHRDQYEAVLAALRDRLLIACVGPITAAPLAAVGVPVISPTRARIGALVRELATVLPARAVRVRAGTSTLELRGQAALVDGHLRPVPPAPMAVLRALAASPGRTLPRPVLGAVLRRHSGRTESVDEHAVETAVGRLRSALGATDLVQTVVKRGYRLAVPAS